MASTVPVEPVVGEVILGNHLSGERPRSGERSFVQGDTIYIGLSISGVPPRSHARVRWFDPKNFNLGEESKALTQDSVYVTFAWARTDIWDPGTYRAEISLNETVIATRSLKIVSR